MEAASSYTCYDENPSQCPQVAKQKGGCYRNKDKCKKVRLQVKVFCISHFYLFIFDIQSCGHCKGLTPVASNSNCYDIADGCEKVVANHCHIHRNQEVCKKVRSGHPNYESFSFTNSRAVDFVEIRLLLWATPAMMSLANVQSWRRPIAMAMESIVRRWVKSALSH